MAILRRGLLFVAAFTLIDGPVIARSNEYRHLQILGSGFSDKQIAPNRWRVRGFSTGYSALPLAMYRAALLIKKAGFPYMQVVRSDLSITEGLMVHNSNARFVLVGVRTPDEPLVCENKKRAVRACRTFGTDEVMHSAGRSLGQSEAEIAEDYAAAVPGK